MFLSGQIYRDHTPGSGRGSTGDCTPPALDNPGISSGLKAPRRGGMCDEAQVRQKTVFSNEDKTGRLNACHALSVIR